MPGTPMTAVSAGPRDQRQREGGADGHAIIAIARVRTSLR